MCLFLPLAKRIQVSTVCVLVALAAIPACNKPTVDKSTATLMSFSNASQNLSMRVLPSVIQLDMTYQRQPISDHFEEIFGPPPKSSQVGSGVIISADGFALTNYHVVRGAQNIKVTLNDGRQSKAEIVGTDALTDLALIKLPLKNLTALDFGDSSKSYVGTFVWSFGSPWGMQGSASLGVISSSVRSQYSENPFHEFLQTDASINPGSSGGPLIDASAKIVGINTAIAGDQFAGVGFAIPSNTAKYVAMRLKEHGKIDRAWIGVEFTTPSQDQAIRAGRSSVYGAVITRFSSENTPAETNGLKVGDWLLEINDKKVFGPTQAMRMIAGEKVNEPLKILIQRQSETMTVTVQAKSRPGA